MINILFNNLFIFIYNFSSYLQLYFFKNSAIIITDSHGRNLFSIKNSSNKKLLLNKAQPSKKMNMVLFWTNLTSYKFSEKYFQNWILKKIKNYNVKYLIICAGEIDIRYYANLKDTLDIESVAENFCKNIIKITKTIDIKIIYILPSKPCMQLKSKKQTGKIPYEGLYCERIKSFNNYIKKIFFLLEKQSSVILFDPEIICNSEHCDHDKDHIHINYENCRRIYNKVTNLVK